MTPGLQAALRARQALITRAPTPVRKPVLIKAQQDARAEQRLSEEWAAAVKADPKYIAPATAATTDKQIEDIVAKERARIAADYEFWKSYIAKGQEDARRYAQQEGAQLLKATKSPGTEELAAEMQRQAVAHEYQRRREADPGYVRFDDRMLAFQKSRTQQELQNIPQLKQRLIQERGVAVALDNIVSFTQDVKSKASAWASKLFGN